MHHSAAGQRPTTHRNHHHHHHQQQHQAPAAWPQQRRCGAADAPRLRCHAAPPQHDGVAGTLLPRLLAAATAASISLSSLCGSAGALPLAAAVPNAGQLYMQQVQRLHHARSHLPSSQEAAALQLLLDRDLFTADAWAGMNRLAQYAQYVEQLTASGVEAAPACADCAANRMMLEKAWQTVASEFYDPSGRFSQAKWAGQLLAVLKGHGGALHNRAETYSALSQLMASLGDKYSAFLDPTAYRRALRRPLPAERAYLAAQFVGVGIQFGPLDPQLGGRLVEGPLAGSPAEGAGLRKGDRVLEIDGLPVEGLTLDEITTLCRGPVGSSLELLVARGGAGPSPPAPRRLELERRPLPQPALRDAQLPLPDGRFVQYVRVNYFCHETTSGLAGLVAGAEADGRVAGYVLDLRNDPGGVFEEAVAMSALFEDPTSAVAETVRSNSGLVDVVWRPSGLSRSAWPDLMAGPLTSKPLVLLVNNNTASASEVLAGALHDHGRAVLLGERTFGKGVVQYFFPLGDGSGLKVTTAKYLTPSRYDISREGGLAPDVACHDYPHGVLTPGTADACVISALSAISSAPRTDPLSFSPLLADAGSSDKQ